MFALLCRTDLAKLAFHFRSSSVAAYAHLSASRSTLPPLRMMPTRLPAKRSVFSKSTATGTAARWLDDDFHPLPHFSHGVHRGRVVDRDDFIDQPADDVERQFAQGCSQPIGDRLRMIARQDPSRCQRTLGIVGPRGLGRPALGRPAESPCL